MSCNCECDCVQVQTVPQGTWLIDDKGKNDIHVYSLSNTGEGSNGSCIGFNSRALVEGKLKGTPLCLVFTDKKSYLQVVDDNNKLTNFKVNPTKVRELLMELLLKIKACSTEIESSTQL